MPEQRNPYKGVPPRAWIRLRLVAPDGTPVAAAAEFLVDTGNPCALIISHETMHRLRDGKIPDLVTNFGLLKGGWVNIAVPDLGLEQRVEAYASDQVVSAAKASMMVS